MENVFNLIGFFLAFASFLIVFRIWRTWQGELRDGLLLFLMGFVFLALGFLWGAFNLFFSMPLTDQPLFAMGMALLFAGSFKLFTFVYPQ